MYIQTDDTIDYIFRPTVRVSSCIIECCKTRVGDFIKSVVDFMNNTVQNMSLVSGLDKKRWSK